jgi:hypothetical protein
MSIGTWKCQQRETMKIRGSNGMSIAAVVHVFNEERGAVVHVYPDNILQIKLLGKSFTGNTIDASFPAGTSLGEVISEIVNHLRRHFEEVNGVKDMTVKGGVIPVGINSPEEFEAWLGSIGLEVSWRENKRESIA